MTVLTVIPARFGSTRFPGKPLASLHGKPMIQHVYERVARAQGVGEPIVATDDERIVEAVERFGGRAVMTSAQARTGTDRVAEVARSRRADVVLNVQGDEPLVIPSMLEELAGFLEAHRAVPMASLMTPIRDPGDVENPNVVKVVTDADGFALYFSRAPIPHVRTPAGGGDRGRGARDAPGPLPQRGFKHLGIYGYQRDFLLQFPSLEPRPLEGAEQLEQLRALEHGYRIKLLDTAQDTVGIDTPEDLRRVEALMAGRGQGTPWPSTSL